MMRDKGIFAASTGLMILAWALAAWVKADPQILPGPVEVLRIAWAETLSGALPHHMAATLWRVALSFALAMGLGTAIGIALGLMPRVDRWADPWVIVFLNLPALMVIVLCYLWIGLSEAAAIVAVTLNKAAMVIVTLREGTRALDRPMAEMAQVYRLSPAARLRHVMLPQLAPHVATAARNGLAMIWKIVLVAEFLGRSDGIGFQIHFYFQLFQTGHLLAYALAFVALMVAADRLVITPWTRAANVWRGNTIAVG